MHVYVEQQGEKGAMCVYVRMYLCMHGWMDGWRYIYVCMYVCMCVCVYVCTRVYVSGGVRVWCLFICMYTWVGVFVSCVFEEDVCLGGVLRHCLVCLYV